MRKLCAILALFFVGSRLVCADDSFDSLVKRLGNTHLIVSNEPESLRSPGLVFDGALSTMNLRVMYHHRNVSTENYTFVVLLSNPNETKSVVRVSKGEGGPTKDVVFSGHKAAFQFMSDWTSGGRDVEIPPHSTQSVVMHALKPDQTTSGIVSLEKLSAGAVGVKMMVVDTSDESVISGFSDSPDVKGAFKRRYFEDSFREINRTFDVRDRVALISVGGPPYVMDMRRGYVMKGNYGVMYAISLRILNPLDDSRRIRILFLPSKFESVDRGVIYRAGKVYETGMVVGKGNRFQAEMIDELLLNPGESRLVQWLMLPQAGCFYPVDIIIKTVE